VLDIAHNGARIGQYEEKTTLYKDNSIA